MRNYLVLVFVLFMASPIWGQSSSTTPDDDTGKPKLDKVSDFAGSCLELMDEVDNPEQGNDFSESMLISSTTTTGCVVSSTFITSTELSSPEDKDAYQELQQYRFVRITRDNLKIDMARGTGEYLITMAYLEGCPAEIHDIFSKMAQRNFSRIFSQPKSNPTTILINLETQMAADPLLAAQCSGIS